MNARRRREDGKARVDPGLCVDCLTCVDECPSGAISLDWYRPVSSNSFYTISRNYGLRDLLPQNPGTDIHAG
ncbi:DUF362 domain-containing protein [Methanoculleus sp.]|uniref:DUF362 domain-containing protein n=1 Tax=Methanoculleus sp. TaxID=90427 RepID=UPI002FC6A371